jgi:hypothetical protein
MAVRVQGFVGRLFQRLASVNGNLELTREMRQKSWTSPAAGK